MGKKTFITFFKNVLKNIQLKPKKPKKTQYPKWDFMVVLGFLGFLGLNPPPVTMVVKIINKKPDDQELKTLCHNSKVGGELNFSTSHTHRTTLDIVYKVKVASCVKLLG